MWRRMTFAPAAIGQLSRELRGDGGRPDDPNHDGGESH
jgi:hypothetical protein